MDRLGRQGDGAEHRWTARRARLQSGLRRRARRTGGAGLVLPARRHGRRIDSGFAPTLTIFQDTRTMADILSDTFIQAVPDLTLMVRSDGTILSRLGGRELVEHCMDGKDF